MKLAFTVSSLSHLGQAKSMADSFLQHNPDYRIFIGVIDRIAGRLDEETFGAYELVEVEKVGIPNLPELCERFDNFEMCGLARPFIATYLLNRYPEVKTMVYIDTDILVFDTMKSVEEELEDNDILLTPHMTNAYPEDSLYPLETAHLNSGLYNSGFWAVRRSDSAVQFLTWWGSRLAKYGYVNFMDGMFVDQLWLNYVPLFFPNVRISENQGLNAGYWNLHERDIQKIDNQYIVNEKYPLVFFHFSGVSAAPSDKISVHTDRYTLTNRPELRPLFETYRAKLNENNHAEFLKLPNLLIPPKSYKKWGKLREYALRIARKTIRELHG